MKITRKQLRQIIKEEIGLDENRMTAPLVQIMRDLEAQEQEKLGTSEEQTYRLIKIDHDKELSDVIKTLKSLGYVERIRALYTMTEPPEDLDVYLSDLVTDDLVTGIMDAALPASEAKEALTKLAGNKQYLEKFIREIEMSSTSDPDTGEHLEDHEGYRRAANMLKQAVSSRK